MRLIRIMEEAAARVAPLVRSGLAVLWLVATVAAANGAAAQQPRADPLHGHDVHGVVVDADDGTPLAGAHVRVVELSTGELTHGDGSFHLEGLRPGRYTLRADRLGYATVERTVLVEDEGVGEIRIELSQTALRMDPITVTATARARSAGEALRSVEVLGEAQLLRRLDATVAGTLRSEPGVAVASVGPATEKPVIRGLSGDRVLVLEDGERTGDLAAASIDHASATDALSARRMEVVRGPAALLYGSNALGGVVNVIRDEVPRAVPDRLTGRATVEAASVTDALAASAEARFGLGERLALRVEGTGRTAGDLATPSGSLENTDAEMLGFSSGASWVLGGDGYVGAAYRHYENEYGIPGGFTGAHPEGVRIEMRRDQARTRAEWHELPSPASRVELSATFTDYQHEEIESSGAVGTAFDRHTATAEARLHHDALGPFSSGALGARYQWDDHRFGGVDTEDARRSTFGVYLLQEILADPWTLEAGIRYDRGRVTPERERTSSRIGLVRERTFDAFSGSVGALVSLRPWLSLGASASRAFRIPDVGELYSEGPHLAAYSFEVGNPSLNEEIGLGLDLHLRLRTDAVRGELTLFRNEIDGYVFPRNTGETSPVQLPIYQFAGEDAVLEGLEASAEWGLSDRWVLEGSGSWVRGTLTATDEPIPFMPPLSGNGGIRYDTPGWFAEARVRAAAEQDRVGEFETPTDSYAVVDASAGVRLDLGGRLHTLTLRLTNLTDREYRNHLSRTKEIMPEAGRGASLLYRVSF